MCRHADDRQTFPNHFLKLRSLKTVKYIILYSLKNNNLCIRREKIINAQDWRCKEILESNKFTWKTEENCLQFLKRSNLIKVTYDTMECFSENSFRNSKTETTLVEKHILSQRNASENRFQETFPLHLFFRLLIPISQLIFALQDCNFIFKVVFFVVVNFR